MKSVLLAIAFTTASVCSVWAQPDSTFTYQGNLMDAGSPANGSFAMDFKLFDALVGGSQAGPTVTIGAQSVAGGLFNSELDFGAQNFAGGQYWLEITVDGFTLSPRTPITASPFSVQTRGLYVDSSDNVGIGTDTPADDLHLFGDGATLRIQDDSEPGSFTLLREDIPDRLLLSKYRNSGQSLIDIDPIPLDTTSKSWVRLFRNVNTTGTKQFHLYRGDNTTEISASIGVDGADSWIGAHGGNLAIGHTAPLAKLHVKDDLVGDVILGENANTIGGQGVRGVGFTGVYGLSAAFSGTGVFGAGTHTTGSNYGVSGLSQSSSGIGVYGLTDSTTGDTKGVFGQSYSPTGTGVYGEGFSTTGTNYGVFGKSNSPDGYGVYGYAWGFSGPATGVYGRTTSTEGKGVYGKSESVSGVNFGVYGETASFDGRGVYGVATRLNGTTYGVYGNSASETGIGVLGQANASTAVNYGVYGISNSVNGYDFYAGGAGINYGSGSSIRWKNNVRNIDNPLDKLAALRGVYFDWDEEHGGQHDIGMIAEEVGKVLPEIVAYEENGYDANGMDYSKMTPLLVEAVNALRIENDALRERLQAIESRLSLNNTTESDTP